MKNNHLVILIIMVLIIIICLSCSENTEKCNERINVGSHNLDKSYSKPGSTYYEELPDLSPDNSDENMYWTPSDSSPRWSTLSSNVLVSFVSSNIRFSKNILPRISLQEKCTLKAWKGEKVHIQILLWTNIDINNLSVEINSMNSNDGKSIEVENIEFGFVRYVMTSPGYGNSHNSLLSPDPIDIIDKIPVMKNTVQPIWLSVKVPHDIDSGIYNGIINVIADKTHALDLTIEVNDHTLPPPKEWEYDLDLWQHPASIARLHNVPLWSDEHFELLRPYYKLLADAGQKVITASIVDEPWNHQTYNDYPSLINRIKKSDGTWYYDYSLFEKYIKFLMSCGIDKRINCYTLTKLTYHNENTESEVSVGMTDARYKEYCTHFLKDFTKYLKMKNWFSITSIALDESPGEVAKKIIDLVKSVDQDWKLAYAGNFHPQLEKEIYDYCIYLEYIGEGQIFSYERLKQRVEQGMPSTFYTCCGPGFPNTFTFSPPAEAVWFGWYAAKTGLTGYLRWAYESWPANPLRDSRYPAQVWPGGDTYLIYPGPRTSIRFEKLIEGIQDFEKIRIIRNLHANDKNNSKLIILEEKINAFNYDVKMSNINTDELVIKAQEILNSF